MSSIQTTFRSAWRVIRRNAPTILAGVSIASTVGATILSAKATPKAIQLIEEETFRRREDLTPAQLRANVALIRYLQDKYPTIRSVWGHDQQTAAKASGLYKEQVQGYFHGKVDPGPKFMKGLQRKLKDTGLLFFKP